MGEFPMDPPVLVDETGETVFPHCESCVCLHYGDLSISLYRHIYYLDSVTRRSTKLSRVIKWSKLKFRPLRSVKYKITKESFNGLPDEETLCLRYDSG